MPKTAIQQGTEEWLEVRARNVTATDVYAVYTSRIAQQAILRRWKTGKAPKAAGPAIEFGQGCEPRAREIYSAKVYPVDDGGFWVHPRHKWLYASPDGFHGKMCVEFKCPYSTPVPTEPPAKYVFQLMTQLAVTESKIGRIVYWSYTHEPGEPRDAWEVAFGGSRLRDKLTVFEYEYSPAFENVWHWIGNARREGEFSPFSPMVVAPQPIATFKVKSDEIVLTPCVWDPAPW